MGAFGRFLSMAALALSVAGGAAAQDGARGPLVIELFTSQGCSSCPPADALLAELARRDDVLPLALHVDYWDYIGWEDTFARPEHTRRQKAYAYAAGAHSIYTPQLVVGGTRQLVGNKTMELGEMITAHKAGPAPVALRVVRNDTGLAIRAEARHALPGVVVVQLVRYRPQERVTIARGENAGRTITYVNIVTDWREIARWSGAEPLDITAETPGAERAAVILQENGTGPILAAAVAP